MKKYFLLLLVVFAGCMSEKGYLNPSTNEIVTPEAYRQLPESQQVLYEPVTVKQVDPGIAAKIDTGLAATQGVVQVVKPLIPEPFATGGIALLGGIIALWQTVKRMKTASILDRVKKGAQITAESVDKIIRPSVDLFNAFKARQKDKSDNTDAIMPDKLVA